MRLNICSASHFIHVSAYGYVSLTNKEDSLKVWVWYDYVVWKFWLFDMIISHNVPQAFKKKRRLLITSGAPIDFFSVK